MQVTATMRRPKTSTRPRAHKSWQAVLSLLVLPLSGLFAQGCASTPPPPPKITAEVVSEPAGATVSFQGRQVGSAPLNLPLQDLAQALEVTSAEEAPPVVERRIKVLTEDRVRVTLRLDSQPSALARKLGLTRVVVFDYDDRATFDLNSAALKESFEPVLRRQAALLAEQFEGLDIYVCGHTDSTGSQEGNMLLSLERAQAVGNFLTSVGVSPTRLKIQGFGWDYPVADNATDKGRALNRRTEILLPD